MIKDLQYYKFCLYGFLKNLRFFEPFFILFFLSKDLSFVEIGALYALREIAVNLFEIPSGIIADTLGRRRTLASSFLAYIFAFVLFYISQQFMVFAAAMLFYALGNAIRSGINKAMIVDYLKHSGQFNFRVSYYGHTRSWSQFGSAISSLLGGILYFFSHRLDIIFLFSIVPYLLDFINILSYPAFLDKTTKQQKTIRERLAINGRDLLGSFRDKHLIRAIFNSAVYSGYYKGVKDFIQPFLKALIIQAPILLFFTEHEKTAIALGVIYFIIFLLNGLVARNAGRISGIFASNSHYLNYTLIAGIFLGVISGLLIDFFTSMLAVLAFILMLLMENARKPAGISVIMDDSSGKVHAGILSVVSQLASVFTAIFVIIIGLFADHFGVGSGIALISFSLLCVTPFIRILPAKA